MKRYKSILNEIGDRIIEPKELRNVVNQYSEPGNVFHFHVPGTKEVYAVNVATGTRHYYDYYMNYKKKIIPLIMTIMFGVSKNDTDEGYGRIIDTDTTGSNKPLYVTSSVIGIIKKYITGGYLRKEIIKYSENNEDPEEWKNYLDEVKPKFYLKYIEYVPKKDHRGDRGREHLYDAFIPLALEKSGMKLVKTVKRDGNVKIEIEPLMVYDTRK